MNRAGDHISGYALSIVNCRLFQILFSTPGQPVDRSRKDGGYCQQTDQQQIAFGWSHPGHFSRGEMPARHGMIVHGALVSSETRTAASIW